MTETLQESIKHLKRDVTAEVKYFIDEVYRIAEENCIDETFAMETMMRILKKELSGDRQQL